MEDRIPKLGKGTRAPDDGCDPWTVKDVDILKIKSYDWLVSNNIYSPRQMGSTCGSHLTDGASRLVDLRFGLVISVLAISALPESCLASGCSAQCSILHR